MRGYFGIGVEGISKAMNAGSLFRTGHAFGASFLFTVGAVYSRFEGNNADTSDAPGQVPLYHFADPPALMLPEGCRLVGVELLDDAVDLPSFRHPTNAAYVLGPERGSLSPAQVERCEFVVKIPTRFCVNLAVAAAIVMYDRVTSLGRFAARPLWAGGPAEALAPHTHGAPVFRKREAQRRAAAHHASHRSRDSQEPE